MVDLGGQPGRPANLFRITPAGAHWLGLNPLPALISPAQLVVHDVFVVAASLRVPLADRYRLLRVTEPAEEPEKGEKTTYHRITRRSLSRARQRGLSGEKLAGFLRRATHDRLPAKVDAALLRWDQHRGSVRVSKGAVLRVEDAAVLGIMRSDSVIGPLLSDLLSPQAVLVSEANLPKILAVLQELGYAIDVEEPRSRSNGQR
jgi:hypothetical protein